MDTYFVTGQAEGRLLNRIQVQHGEDGKPFALFDLADITEMYTLPPCQCVAEGVTARALAVLTARGDALAIRGPIHSFVRTLPTGKQVRVENALIVSEFRILDDDARPEALPV